MNFDLIFLSSRIALLVLVGSALGFVLGWLWRRWLAARMKADYDAKLDAEHDLRKRLQEQMEERRRQLDELQSTSKESEQQCLAALQQRDAAEHQAADAMNRLRGLQEQLERSQRGAEEFGDVLLDLEQTQARADELKREYEAS